ncbi:hypothetical protein Caci_3746 [Catenulispora acidiphila DSM 44928]|uniref:Uncharacterized protein n=1 Tax=Catenulispora acidiphila (strain DSM 44928 / JCM 14897 / NBRC 102108 / NRRL B-24433 / ID139908) TaxID=479433 RepID=C7QC29_CATAD|nr:hypothetical protein Caci_3746 [Catenulispora acidiphila DSM 44928]
MGSESSSSPPPADAWPFLISRGRTVGQRVVLAPNPLISAGRHADLLPSVAQATLAADDIERSQFHDPASRTDYTLFFRRPVAHAGMIGQEGGDLLDEHSRKVVLTEGVVIAGSPEDFDPRLLDEALRITKETFRAFWLADDPHIAPVPAPRLVPGATTTLDLSAFQRRSPRGGESAPPPQPTSQPSGEGKSKGEKDDSHPRSLWQSAARLAAVVGRRLRGRRPGR